MGFISKINRPLSHDEKIRLIQGVLFAVIIVLGSYFRLIHLHDNPGWYFDEGEYINYADNLYHGHWQLFNIVATPMLLMRPPLFVYLLAGTFSVFGVGIIQARTLVVILSLIEFIFIYRIGRKIGERNLTVLAMALYAILPQFVEFDRMAYTYAATGLFGLMGVDFILTWLENKRHAWWLLACLAAGLAVSSDYIGLVFACAICLVIVVKDPKRFFPTLIIILIPVALVLTPAFIFSPKFALEDMGFVYGYRISSPLMSQITNIIINYGELIRSENWVVVGIAGLFLIPHSRVRYFILGITLASLILIVHTALPVGRGMHYLILVFPYLAIGMAFFMLKAYSIVYGVLIEWFIQKNTIVKAFGKMGSYTLAIWLIFSPMVWMLLANISQSVQGYYFLFTGNNDMALVSSADAEKVISYLKLHAMNDSIMLASADLAWALPSERVADLNCALSNDINHWSDQPVVNLNQRQFFSCSLSNTDYVVLTPHSVKYAVSLDPRMTLLLDRIYTWNLVYQAGSLAVYHNPLKSP